MQVVFPITIAPSANNGFKTAASSFALKSRNARVPFDVGKSLVLTLSFAGMGSPCSIPSGRPAARALSIDRAACSTMSPSRVRKALRLATACALSRSALA
jgi:hypothetical protein